MIKNCKVYLKFEGKDGTEIPDMEMGDVMPGYVKVVIGDDKGNTIMSQPVNIKRKGGTDTFILVMDIQDNKR